MAYASGWELASEVSKAGGLGFIGAGYVTDVNWATEELTQAAAVLPRNVHGCLPIGIGFITWHLATSPIWQDVIASVLDARPAAIWFSFGDAAPIIRWIREREQAAATEVPCRVFVQVQTVAGALEAVSWGADVIIAQGGEAGGHSAKKNASTVCLLPEVIDAVRNTSIPVLAAGGIADGRGVAAVLAMGAAAAVIGTRFIVSKECPTNSRAKQAIIDGKDGGVNTVKLDVLDRLRRFDWPSEYAIRTMRNNITEAYEQDGSMPDPDAFAEAARQGDTTMAMVTTGQNMGLVHELLPASEIVHKINVELKQAIQQLSKFV
ncbi:2-nitropropane dioxygenase [Syncephalis fuscata]|nr:2-nitropropane dioxygenase [Syncephalis fuscata]